MPGRRFLARTRYRALAQIPSQISAPGRPAASSRLEKSMDNAARTRQRVLALFLPSRRCCI